MENQIFIFNGNKITFQFGNGDIMVNVTEFAKAFSNKNLSQIINSKEIKDYISELSAIQNYIASDLLIVENGRGTWAHQRVALRIAQKLSTKFSIWVDERIEELLRHGLTATPQKIDELIQNPDLVIGLATQLKQERQQTEYLRQQSEKQEKELQKQAPKVEYYNNVLNSESTYNTNLIAKELGMSARTLNKILADNKIQYKQAGVWVLNHKFQDKGFTKTKTTLYKGSDGIERTCMLTVWTEKGREFIHHQISTLKTA
ncbi:phage antirepressor protein [Apibacter sp. B3706]|uniref:phage antirepressor KilAC domain-containing protein n=1 Tax=Apibacter sp. B3706 TaxID=2656760 RepID=UPI00140E2C10|nr:phage antirepressor KilAC domain-containing protein [Apibacter sp. B3706]QII69998.1 phage antirepressor protein [Apibacter sp. B3706]